MKHPFQPFAAALRKLGFRKAWAYRESKHNPAVTQYEKRIDSPSPGRTRGLHVQLWGDGGHRVAHGEHGREITTPTDFRTVAEMRLAIQVESLRPHVAEAS
jgi:hypothetical protein